MSIKIEDHAIYRTSEAVVTHPIGADTFAVWNRYLPSVIFLNHDGIQLLEYMKTNNQPYKRFRGFKRVLRQFITAELLYCEEKDIYKDRYLMGGQKLIDDIALRMKEHCEKKLPYWAFGLFTQACNLDCPYCIVNYVRPPKEELKKRSKREKLANLIKLIDRLYHYYGHDTDDTGMRVMLNGGEILLEWDVVKTAIEYIKETYPKARIGFDMNTNATLMTDEIAQFITDNKFTTVGVSFDGYKESHNKTRRYHNGKGSFDDVLQGVQRLNKYRKEPLRFFQGTLTGDHDIDLDRLMKMKEYGFESARLGINLIGISLEEAKRMADFHFDMAVKSIEAGWSVMDDYFKAYKSILSAKAHQKEFTFFCRGLTDLAGKTLYYNMDTEKVNLLCHYVTDAHLSLEEIDYDIYHPLIFEKSVRYLDNRFQTFKTECADCEIAGICRGGCVISGIDSYNKVNESACLFLKETWKHYVKYAYSENQK